MGRDEARMPRLTDRVALVTGGARGTGKAIARLFAAEGARVVVGDIRDEEGLASARELGSQVRYIHLDVTRENDWLDAVGSIERTEGALDILVNNAGVLHLSTIDETPLDAFRRVMEVNCTGAFLGTQKCLALLRRSSAGSIVNIGSTDGVRGLPGTVGYTASKFALRGLTKVTALENGKHGVRANCVCPAAGNPMMHQDLVAGHLAPRPVGGGSNEAWPARPLGISGDCEDVALAALFFASEESRFCTGTELLMDGGAGAGTYASIPGVFSTEA